VIVESTKWQSYIEEGQVKEEFGEETAATEAFGMVSGARLPDADG